MKTPFSHLWSVTQLQQRQTSYLLLVLCLLFFCSCEKSQKAPLKMTFELLGNDQETGVCLSRISLENISQDTVFADWVIYFNQMSIVPLINDTAAIQIEQIEASYHRLYPTEHYRPLAPGERLSQTVRHKGAIVRQSDGPQGPFVVINSKPMTVELENIYSTDGHEFQRKVAHFPYADGEWMWKKNERFSCAVNLNDSCFHLLPQPKHISYLDGTTRIDRSAIESLDTTLRQDEYLIEAVNDEVRLTGQSPRALYYAHLTLRQIEQRYGSMVRSFTLRDYPDIYHRGLMLDIARNFTSKEEILRLIDLLAEYKMSVLHLHLTDDEGWRLEIPGLEELTTVGSKRGYTIDERECLYPMYSGGWDPDESSSSGNGYLSRKDFIDILRYAKTRYIDIVPEIDIPGHSRAAIKAMEARYFKYIDKDKEKAEEYLLSDFADTSVYVSAQHYTDNVICIALPSCYTFVKKVIDEVVAMYREADAPLHIFHVGGDEVPRGAWLGSPKVAEYVAAHRDMESPSSPKVEELKQGAKVSSIDVANLKDAFLESIIAILDEYGLEIAGWEEIAYRGGHPNPRFANRGALTYCWNSVPEWRGDEKPYTLANVGYPVMVCCVTNLYFDMCYLNHEEERGLSWGGYIDDYQSFLLRPEDLYRSVETTRLGLPRDLDAYAQGDKVALIPDSAHNIKGIQAQIWSETIRNKSQLESYLLPKLLGLAERAWNSDYTFSEREELLRAFNAQTWQIEVPRLVSQGLSVHLIQPGIHRADDGLVYMNTPMLPYLDCEIRYTLDGSLPDKHSELYTAPFSTSAPLINAACFYKGLKSNTTHHLCQQSR